MANKKKSLKAQNLPMIVCVLIADVVVVALVASLIDVDEMSVRDLKRLGSVAIFSVLALLLVNMAPAGWRDCLGNLRLTQPLPGNRAFTEYGFQDDRIDMVALERTRGPLPSIASEQNAFWYKLYKEVGDEVSVTESHKRYLLFRDLATMSLVLLIGSPLIAIGFDWSIACKSAILFAVQTVLFAITSRNTAIRFVTNVMVLHSAMTVSKPKKKRLPKNTAL